MSIFQKATKQQKKLRFALVGPPGAGKTYTALKVATKLGAKVAVIDTERGSASAYADKFDFDTVGLTSFSPQNYIEAIKAAEAAGFDVLIIDSLSHAWNGTGGVLDVVEAASARARGNSYAGWREGTPLQNQLVDAILQSNCHIIATMRSKTEYVLEKDERTGKTAPRKIGMAPVQRDGVEYEFDVIGEIDVANTLVITKTRCSDLNGAVIKKPGDELALTLKHWLGDGAPATAAVAATAVVVSIAGSVDAPVTRKLVIEDKTVAAKADTLELDLLLSLIEGAKEVGALEVLVPQLTALSAEQKKLARVAYNNKKKALSANGAAP